jgi:opacity protein-like surface antigen
MKRLPGVVLVVLCTLWPAGSQAQGLAASTPWSFGFGIGTFDPRDDTGRLKNQSGQYSLTFDASYRRSNYLSFGFDIFANDQRIDTPPTVTAPFLGTVDGRANIAGGGINAVAKLCFQVGRIEPYVGAVVGVYFNSMIVTGTVLGLPARAEEKDTGLGEQLLAGVNVRVSDTWLLGFEYRRTFLRADFGRLSSGEVDLGGNSYLLTMRWSPRTR